MEQITKVIHYLQTTDNGIVLIAVGLGVFFLFAAFVKGIRTRHHRQLRESSAQAAANGGTAEAPVHIGGNPYEIASSPAPATPVPETPAPPAQAPAVQQDVPAAPPANEPADNPNAYVWE